MRVIGIDPGTAITGYGIVNETSDGSLESITYGVIETSSQQTMPVRLLQMHEELGNLISLYRPEVGAVEKLFFQRNVRTAMAVGQGRGVVLLTMAKAGLPIEEYTPMEVKQSISGYGGADKMQVQLMVRALLGLAELPQPDDAADALAVAICHIHSAKMRGILNAPMNDDGL